MVDVRGALLARNVEYIAGQVGTRVGYQVVNWNALTVYTSQQMYAWYAPFSAFPTVGYGDVALASFSVSGPNVQVINLKTRTTIMTLSSSATPATAAGATMVAVGLRLYVAYHDTKQRGLFASTGGWGVVYADSGSSSQANGALFPGPWKNMSSTFAASASGSGAVTAGLHRIGFLLEFPSGFTTRASPDTGTTSPPSVVSFAPLTVTSVGSDTIVTAVKPISTTTAAEPVAFSVIMTTVGNLNQYYIVPGSRTVLTGYPGTTGYTISISDADLASQGVDATPYLYWLTCDANSLNFPQVPPFSPSHLCLFGDRMAYKGYQKDNKGSSIDCLYVSERNNYQAITPDQHLVMLPGQRQITTMFRMGGSNYIAGPHEIYSVTDTGDVPVTWPAPHLVDGRVGTLAVHGVEVSPSGQYAWIADESGLFLFTGAPITAGAVSYYQESDWSRINWAVAYLIQLKDHAGAKRLHILVPLDGATTLTHVMTYDYTDGADYQSVRYSLDSISGYNIGSMELVQNNLPGQATGNQEVVEVWLGPRTGTTYLRKTSLLDTTPYHDDASTAIASTYRTAPLPGRGGLINLHHGFHARLKGAGTITPTLYDIDAVRSFVGRTATLSVTPDADILFLMEMRGELAFVEFATNTADTHWHLAYLKYYYSPYLMQR